MKGDLKYTNPSNFQNTSFYHGIASVIIACIEKRINFINRGLFEVKNLQAENFVSEKFAITTYVRLCEGFLRDFIELQPNVEVHMYSVTTNSIKVYESKNIAKYRLIFYGIDNILNFSRGLSECGISFALEAILPSNAKAKYEAIFSGFYSFKLQKVLYAEHKGAVYLENKRAKALHRNGSFVAITNSNAIFQGYINEEKCKNARVKQLITTDSTVSDIFSLAMGSVDGIIYRGIKVLEAIPIMIASASLSCFTSKTDFSNSNLLDTVDLTVGCEPIVKNFQ